MMAEYNLSKASVYRLLSKTITQKIKNVMNITISPDLKKRLICSKYLFINGVDTIQNGTPFNAGFAILNFQDSVELFLRVIAEYTNTKINKQVTFNNLIDKINEKNSNNQLTHTSQLNQLNNSRVSFKHVLLEPRLEDVKKFRNDLESFFQTASQSFFNLDFNRLSLVSLVKHRRSENFLYQAENDIINGDYVDSQINATIAFEVFRRYCKKIYDENSHYRFDSDFQHFNEDNVKAFAKGVEDTFTYHERLLSLLSNGVSILDYKKFERFTPKVNITMAGTFNLNKSTWDTEKYCNYENSLFCVNFVTNYILQLQKNHLEPHRNYISKYVKYKVISDSNIIVFPVDNPEIIRVAKKGEIIKSYEHNKEIVDNGYIQILQDNEIAYIENDDLVIHK